MNTAIHASMLTMGAKCMEQVRWRYVEGERAPPGIALLVGSSVHAARELDLVRKRDTGAPLPEGDVVDAAATDFDRRLAEEERVIYDDGENAGTGKDQAVSLARLHSREVTPKLEPLHVERKLRVAIPGLEHEIEGTLDLQTHDRVIHDCKTAKKSPTSDELAGSIQLQLYSLLAESADGAKPAGIALDVLLKNKTPKSAMMSAGPVTTYAPLMERIRRFELALASGNFMPAMPGSWWCSTKFCGYYDRCVFGARARVSISMNTGPGDE